MSRVRRACGMLAVAVALLGHGGAVRVACGQSPVPEPIEALSLFQAIEHGAAGELDLDEWLAIERCLEVADRRAAGSLEPLRTELSRIATAQSWLNWPAIKPAPVRHLRDRCVDALRAVDHELFQGAIAGITALNEGAKRDADETRRDGERPRNARGDDHSLVRELRRMEQRRIRELFPPWPLLDASPVELDRIVDRMIRGVALDDAPRREVDRLRAEWAENRAAACLAQRDLRRDIFDRYEARLVELGVDLADLGAPGEAWMIAAFDAWEAMSGALADQAREMVEQDRRATAAIGAHLSPTLAAALNDAVASRAFRLSGQDNKAFAGDEFDRALRVKGVSAEFRGRIRDARTRWSGKDAALVAAWSESLQEKAPCWCPLTYSHWGPDSRYAFWQARRLELDHDRIELAEHAIAELRTLLGASADLLGEGVPETDERLEPLPPFPAIEDWSKPDRGWIIRGSLRLFSVQASACGWFDPGAISEGDFEQLLAWIGLDEKAAVAIATMQRDLAAELDAKHPMEAHATGWIFDGAPKRHDAARADRILAESTARAALLLSLERDLWDAALGLADSEHVRRRIRLVAAVRELQVLLQPIAAPFAAVRFEHRGETMVAAAILAAALRDHASAARDGGLELARERSDRLLEIVDPQLESLLASARARHEASAATARSLMRLRDQAMWASEAMRRQVDERTRALRAVDDPARSEFIARQEELLATLRSSCESGRDAAPIDSASASESIAIEAVRLWEASALPSVRGSDLAATRAIERDAARESPMRERLARLRAWLQERDDALAEEAIALCISADQPAIPISSEMQRTGERLRAIAGARRELGDRAEIRRRLLWRSVNGAEPEGSAPQSDDHR